jgi:hypothetical protein
MNMPEVKCTVADCEYWATGNNCDAKTIIVEVDQHANADYSSEFAQEALHGHQDRALSARNTCCHTFEPKKKQ